MRYPSLTVRYVERPMTLREFLLSLGRGDRVVIFPIASGDEVKAVLTSGFED